MLILFRRPGIERPLVHCLPMPGIEQVDGVKLLIIILIITITITTIYKWRRNTAMQLLIGRYMLYTVAIL